MKASILIKYAFVWIRFFVLSAITYLTLNNVQGLFIAFERTDNNFSFLRYHRTCELFVTPNATLERSAIPSERLNKYIRSDDNNKLAKRNSH